MLIVLISFAFAFYMKMFNKSYMNRWTKNCNENIKKYVLTVWSIYISITNTLFFF